MVQGRYYHSNFLGKSGAEDQLKTGVETLDISKLVQISMMCPVSIAHFLKSRKLQFWTEYLEQT